MKRKNSGKNKDQELEPSNAPLSESVQFPPGEDVGNEKLSDISGLEKVMVSIQKLFGEREFASDQDLDDFLDSKIASGELPPSAVLSPLDEAQSVVYEAWNSSGPRKVELAKQALEISVDCADAYIILAEEDAGNLEKRRHLYEKALITGEKALDANLFRESVGRFWELVETRPYMRAKLGLAKCLWKTGDKKAAVDHLQDLLRLNPMDSQGVRYVLCNFLLELGEDEALEKVLSQYEADDSSELRYCRALWSFRREGASDEANRLLLEALKSNPHVPGYLLKKKKLPKQAPEFTQGGDETEAAGYVLVAMDSWHKTLGAIEWLAENSI